MTDHWLPAALGLGIDAADSVFPWQHALLKKFETDTCPSVLDLPTGLGKTSVMAIWLVARAKNARLPRRLVYVVDRRAVVDQATTEAERLRTWVDTDSCVKKALGLEEADALPISTLRGKHVDNRLWLEDPTSPAIIVGTIDMIGSRLLFEGYGVSRKMRPYHAGFLGADTLLVLDEAHLVPPFEEMLKTLTHGEDFKPSLRDKSDRSLRAIVPPFRLMALSATSRTSDTHALRLCDDDEKHPVVKKRLNAPKYLRIAHSAWYQSWQEAQTNPAPSEGADTPEEGASNTPPDSKDAKNSKDAKDKLPLEGLSQRLANEAWKLAKEAQGLADKGHPPARILLFADKRKDAMDAKTKLETLAKKNSVSIETELFVGGRRIFEREEAYRRLETRGFLAGQHVPREKPTFLFATSAAEVGVDLDADHLVCDLVPWERMIQRLGRVNRRGEGKAHVCVLVDDEPTEAERKKLELPPKKGESAENSAFFDRAARHDTLLAPFYRLPTPNLLLDIKEPFENGEPSPLFPLAENASDSTQTRSTPSSEPQAKERDPAADSPCDKVFDASPRALQKLRQDSASDSALQTLLTDASTPTPLYPLLTRALVDAWSMTSLESHTGRPSKVAPWLRGWEEDDQPQTTVIWRKHLPLRRNGPNATLEEIDAFFEAAPPHTSELLETETYLVAAWLSTRLDKLSSSRKPSDIVAFALAPDGTCRDFFTAEELSEALKEKDKDRKPYPKLRGVTLVVSSDLAGLADGLLKEDETHIPRCADDGEPWLDADLLPFRVRVHSGDTSSDQAWREVFRFATDFSQDGEPSRWLLIEKTRHHATTEEARSASSLQRLATHQSLVEKEARRIAKNLDLNDDYTRALTLAALLHDEGKNAARWQKAFRSPPTGGPYAKTPGPVDQALLGGYRHEVGSLFEAEKSTALTMASLPDDLQDLVLHLIASHHGAARPLIDTKGCDAPPSLLRKQIHQVALRFARLQTLWGPWGLAWWETLLRSADQIASKKSTPPLTSGR